MTEETSGAGLARFWAFTPAIDLISLLTDVPLQHDAKWEEHEQRKRMQKQDQLRIRRAPDSSIDVHHVIKTAHARASQCLNQQVHFILVEETAEAAARALLLLFILTDEELSVRERVQLYLEVYGNAFVREQTSAYIHRASVQLEDFVCGEELPGLSRLVNLSLTKHRNRDQLLVVLRGWRRAVPFDTEGLRDQRLRYYYGDRFDYRANLMDWNYQNHIQPFAPLVHWRQYKRFAVTGQAFDLGSAPRLEPNRTLAAYIKGRHKKSAATVGVRGFWADVVSGPFYTLAYDITNSIPISRASGCQMFTGIAVDAPFKEEAFRTTLTVPPATTETDRFPYPSLVEMALGGHVKRAEAAESQQAHMTVANETEVSDSSHQNSKTCGSDCNGSSELESTARCTPACPTNGTLPNRGKAEGGWSPCANASNSNTGGGSAVADTSCKRDPEQSPTEARSTSESPQGATTGWNGVTVSIVLGPLEEIASNRRLQKTADICVVGWGLAGRLLLGKSDSGTNTSGDAEGQKSALDTSTVSSPHSPSPAGVLGEEGKNCLLSSVLKPGGTTVVESLKYG
ncbi:hypothetical protein cyc_04158 [Cyclospora cayetanensis]|uniref:Dynein assembly factor 3 C-terminal domain-containing protein n=1 Tax=Cyclospora cayetanensis TaxID=88456 RepID=A0A1D3CWU5_9EIME|nr:hypothetical protein cyc_04158 [Cyclospora cayetanensis]